MSGKLRIFLAGEGSRELGSRAGHVAYQSDDRPGVIQALLRKVREDGWEIGGATMWKSIRKLRVGRADHADTHNVRGAALAAKEAKCAVLAFSRDRDNDMERVKAVEDGIRAVEADDDHVAMAGCVVIPKLEGWILALKATLHTEDMSPTAVDRAASAAGIVDGAAMVAVVDAADLATLPADAHSLRTWLQRRRCAERVMFGSHRIPRRVLWVVAVLSVACSPAKPRPPLEMAPIDETPSNLSATTTATASASASATATSAPDAGSAKPKRKK